MWGALENVFVTAVIALLQAVIKNPKSIKTEGAIISQLAQSATQADLLVNGNVWTETPKV